MGGGVELCSVSENGGNPLQCIPKNPLSISPWEKQPAITRIYWQHLVAVPIAVGTCTLAHHLSETSINDSVLAPFVNGSKNGIFSAIGFALFVAR
jgi:hypothetical protein